MSGLRGGVEESRERKVALFLTLTEAFERGTPVTQEEIFAELRIDEFPYKGKVPTKRLAYEGAFDAKRQKFERDKADIRDLGFQIETLFRDDRTGYWIDQRTAYAPPLDFTDDEQRVVAVALRVLGFGSAGVARLFVDGPVPTSGGLAYSAAYTPILAALHDRRVIRFRYRSRTSKQRTLWPLRVHVDGGNGYVVGVVDGSEQVKGFRINRIESEVEILGETFSVSEEQRTLAREWNPHFDKDLEPLRVAIETNEAYARVLPVGEAIVRLGSSKNGRVRAKIDFDGLVAARYALLECAEHVRLLGPEAVKKDLETWLKGVNRPTKLEESAIRFPRTPSGTDTLGPTLQLISAVYQAPDGIKASALADRFAMSTELVKSIMSRLIALQLASDPTTYLVQIEQEDDTDDDVPDPTYVRGSDYEARTGSRFSPLLWRDLFEINIALHQASTLDKDHAITSAIARIEEAVGDWTKVLGVVEPPFLQALHEAIADKEQLKIVYAAESESQFTTRSIEPTEIRMLNGRFFVRAWCHLLADWRNFRVDRIVDVVAKSPRINQPPADTSLNWLSEAGDGGFDVVVVLPPAQRWVFETLTNVQWAVVSDELLAAKVAIRSEDFLDRLMLKAGPGCSVVTHEYAAAGRALARTIEKLL